MYHPHFGLTDPPFKITPDPRLFYTGGERGLVLDALIYAIRNGEGMIKVVGEVGSGKTMLCRMLPDKLADSVDILYLANPRLTPDTILQALALEMQLPIASQQPPPNHLQVMQALHEALLARHGANRQVVLLIEEAQSMPLDTLEEVRLLSNLETTRHKLLQHSSTQRTHHPQFSISPAVHPRSGRLSGFSLACSGLSWPAGV